MAERPAGAQHAPADGTLLPRALGGRVRGAARRPGVRRRRRGGRGPGLAGGTPRHGHRAGEGRRPEGTHRAQLRLPAAGRLPQESLRLMRQAEKFGRPVVCLVDTQGAFCGMEAEERGQGNAIADNLLAYGRPARSGGKRASGGRRQRRGPCARACRPRGHAGACGVFGAVARRLRVDPLEGPHARPRGGGRHEDERSRGPLDGHRGRRALRKAPAPAHENPEAAAENVCAYVQGVLEGLADVPAGPRWWTPAARASPATSPPSRRQPRGCLRGGTCGEMRGDAGRRGGLQRKSWILFPVC